MSKKMRPPYEVTLKFQVDLYGEDDFLFDLESLKRFVDTTLDNGQDGRKDFLTETLEKAVSDLLLHAARRVAYQEALEVYEHQMVEVGTGHTVSKAALESNQKTSGLRSLVTWDGTVCTSIRPVDEAGDEEEG